MIITIIKVRYLPYKSFDIKLTSCCCGESALMKWVIAKLCLSVFHYSDKYTNISQNFLLNTEPNYLEVIQLAYQE